VAERALAFSGLRATPPELLNIFDAREFPARAREIAPGAGALPNRCEIRVECSMFNVQCFPIQNKKGARCRTPFEEFL
jgi:hypothetical protein